MVVDVTMAIGQIEFYACQPIVGIIVVVPVEEPVILGIGGDTQGD
jgi:hypothetical protein